MFNVLLILLGNAIAIFSRLTNKGNGSTWPGHIALLCNPHFIQDIVNKNSLRVVLIAGTNGKTTTAKMITTILEKNGKKVLYNPSGANLLNGIASSLLLRADLVGKITTEYAVFEVDENTIPLLIGQIRPFAIIALNLFRDQLDRYGELDSIAKKWKKTFETLPSSTKLILNADDPQIASLGGKNALYFGLEETGGKKLSHAADSIYCPNCSHKLHFKKIFYSHVGIWGCPNCKLKRSTPDITSTFYPLAGTYNKYNALAAALFAEKTGISKQKIEQALQSITPAFGRQEKMEINGKFVQIFLSKNPVSFNQSLETITAMNHEQTNHKLIALLILNDRIPDGRDVSWIWDIDMEEYIDTFDTIFVSGDRVYDMALRLEYAFQVQNQNEKFITIENLEEAIKEGLQLIKEC